MKRVGVIAAFAGELRPLVRGWCKVTKARAWQPAVWQGAVGAVECIAVAGGMGREAAARACGIAEAFGPLDALVSYGWAGAISCGMQAGESYTVAEAVDAADGERFTPSLPASAGTPLRLVTLDHVATIEEKQPLAERYRAVLVDMEAAAVARFARAKGIGFYCVKSVSDLPGDRLPDFSRFMGSHGELRMPALLCYLACRPRYWRSIERMRKNSRNGARAAVGTLRELMETYAGNAHD